MRKILLLLTAVLLALYSAAGSVATAQGRLAPTLVVYYSYSDNSRAIVSELTSQIEADVLEIQPAGGGEAYDADDFRPGMLLLNAIQTNPANAAGYPALDMEDVPLDGYRNIIVVTPLWWNRMAAVMQSYLFRHMSALAGKTVALIVSSHSSGIAGVTADARRLMPGATWAGKPLRISNFNRDRTSSLIETWLPTQRFQTLTTMTQKLYLTIGGVTRTATLRSNSSAEALVEQLRHGDITYQAHDYSGFEKVGPLGYSFPSNDEVVTTQPGDLILYLGSNLCIYYDTNTWDFTPLGRLDDMTQADIKQFVHAGGSDVSVTLSLSAPTTGMDRVNADASNSEIKYTLQGTIAQEDARGIVIQRGNKSVR